MAQIVLTENEVKVLKQITSLRYNNSTPGVDMDFVASETGLTYEQTEEALKGLHYHKSNILQTFDKRGHWIHVMISDWTYQVAASFN